MGLVEVVTRLVGGVFLMLVAATVAFVDREQLRAALRNPRERFLEVVPHLGVLGVVLGLNRLFRHLGQELSWVIGLNITGLIYAIEGGLVVAIQSIATPALTAYFSFVYLYGYAFLAVFPFVAYWVLEDPTPLRQTIVAFSANYALGLLCYTLFISYGPRNLLPALVEPLLYTVYPQTQLLTSTVNSNTNVFPSLHASLSITVLLLARRTRETYPGWYLLCVPLVASIVFSTMYLGIHWGTDVAAGAILAALSVRIGDRYHDFRSHADGARRPAPDRS